MKTFIKSIFLLFVLLYGLNPAFAMEGKLSDTETNLSRLKQFQQRRFYEPSEDWKKELKDRKQVQLSPHHNTTLKSFHAVENMAEVAEILVKMPSLPNVHRIGCIDLDGTLMSEGGLGWMNCCFKKLPEDRWEHVFKLLLQYGFSSLTEFRKWGNENFPNPMVRIGGFFSGHASVIEPDIPEILKRWHTEGMNLFALTSREDKDSMRTYTQQSLKEEGINFKELSCLSLENNEIEFKKSCYAAFVNNEIKLLYPSMESGIIYSAHRKFGEGGAGISFLDSYLEKFSKKQSPLPSIEVIVVDDYDMIFHEVIGLSNTRELQELQKKFKTDIIFRYFKPCSEWLCPHQNWNDLNYGVDFDKNKIALQALQEFLETFRMPPEKPLPGPFYIGRKAYPIGDKDKES